VELLDVGDDEHRRLDLLEYEPRLLGGRIAGDRRVDDAVRQAGEVDEHRLRAVGRHQGELDAPFLRREEPQEAGPEAHHPRAELGARDLPPSSRGEHDDLLPAGILGGPQEKDVPETQVRAVDRTEHDR
jgi:hypothetical protein